MRGGRAREKAFQNRAGMVKYKNLSHSLHERSRAMLKKAYVEITNRCNLACSFCPKTRRAPRTMSAAEFDLVLSRLEGYVQYV